MDEYHFFNHMHSLAGKTTGKHDTRVSEC